MSITNVTPRETELQKQVIELAESLGNIGWEFELYKQGARATNQKLLDEVAELKAQLAGSAKPYAWRNPVNGVVIDDRRKHSIGVGNGYPNFSEPLYAMKDET